MLSATVETGSSCRRQEIILLADDNETTTCTSLRCRRLTTTQSACAGRRRPFDTTTSCLNHQLPLQCDALRFHERVLSDHSGSSSDRWHQAPAREIGGSVLAACYRPLYDHLDQLVTTISSSRRRRISCSCLSSREPPRPSSDTIDCRLPRDNGE